MNSESQENFPLNESGELSDLHLNPSLFKRNLKRKFYVILRELLGIYWDLLGFYDIYWDFTRFSGKNS